MIELFLCLAFLAYFSFLDIRFGEVENFEILFFLGVGIVLGLMTWQDFYYKAFVAILLFLFCLTLWKYNAIGGADAKIIPCLAFFFIPSSINILLQSILFISILAIVGSSYGLIMKLRKKEKIVFIPAIMASYLGLYFITSLFP